jgi:hypothetical protein
MTFEPPTITLRYGSGSEATTSTRDELRASRLHRAALPDFAEVTGKYPVFAGAICMYAAGSIVQGWGHAASDLDLYVITEDRLTFDDSIEAFVRTVSTKDPLINIVIGEFGAYRADIEVWKAEQVDEVIGRFSCDTPSQEAPELDKAEQDLLYRLASGLPMHGTQWWETRRQSVRASTYGIWLAENRKLTAESYIEDVGGLLVSRDSHTAVLAAHEAAMLAMEALLATYGDYCINRKWLFRRFAEIQPVELKPDEAWAVMTMEGAGSDPFGWAESAGRLAQRLLLTVEGKSVE